MTLASLRVTYMPLHKSRDTYVTHMSYSLKNFLSCKNLHEVESRWALQCVAVCGSVLQCVAVCCSVLQCGAVCCSVLQCGAVCCSVLHRGAYVTHQDAYITRIRSRWCSVLQCVAVCCSVLQRD